MDKSKAREGGRGLLAFFYSDALVKVDRLPYDYKEERDMIRGVLAQSGRKIRFWSERATVQSVRSRLTSGCQMLHFTGHGDAGSLEFEIERQCGKAEILEACDRHESAYSRGDGFTQICHLEGIISAGGTVPDLVFLESCDPVTCGWFVTAAGVRHVIVVKSKSDMPDGTTRDFAASFYNELIANNLTVQKAFRKAVSDVKTTAATFLLPDDIDHDEQILNGLPKGHFIDETPRLPQYFNLPPAEKPCTGMVELLKLLTLLEDKDTSCVTITGEPRVGKTKVALQACHYMGERNQFDAIFFAACREAADHARSFLAPKRTEEHIQRLCQLVGLALHASQDISSPKDLVKYLDRKSGHESTEPTHQETPSRKILLVLDAINALIEGGGIEARKSLVGFVDALCCNMSDLKLLVTSEQGLLEWTDRCLSNSSEKVFPLRVKTMATSSPSQDQVNPRERFYMRAEEISQAEILDKNCRNIWVEAILRAAEHGVTKSHDDDACYRHVPWSYLSSALNGALREVQSTVNEDRSQSEGSSDYGSSGSFIARDLNEGELDFIRNLLRNSLNRDGKDVDGSECGADRWYDRISTGYGYPGKDDGHEWISLEAFAKFSRGWMGPVIATLSKMQREWAASEPVKVHGFISKSKARNLLLETDQSGVFMLRFSASEPGSLLLVVTRKASRKASTDDSPCTSYIEQSPVTVKEGGKWIVGKGRSSKTYNSLLELVHKKRSLKAFPKISPTASSITSLITIEK